MAWFILLLSAMLESVWATALGESEGFTKLVPSLIFFAVCPVSMLMLARAAKHLPIGTAYAVWSGLGAVFTVLVATVLGDDSLTVTKGLFIAGIIACVVALKLTQGSTTSGGENQRQEETSP